MITQEKRRQENNSRGEKNVKEKNRITRNGLRNAI